MVIPEPQKFLQVLVNPKDPNVDIVAVHGLNTTNTKNHAEAAWTSKGKLWLRDFLPTSLPTARVLLFGYNANVAFETSIAGVREQATDLLNQLDGKREHSKDRPIIFIAHSMGGIVVKRALVEAKLNDSYKAIREATYGIAFFGTPHKGGKHVKLGDLATATVRGVLRGPFNSFLEAMKKDSLFADALEKDFQHLFEDYKILSFYETRPMGKFGLVVDKDLATLGLPGLREKQIPMDADHVGICKFASMDGSDYKQVASNLIELANYAVKSAADKTRKVPLSSSALSEMNQQYIRALRSTDPRDDRSRIEATKDPLLEDSCSWIFEDQSFLDWWNCDDSTVLWIHGDPGKGKTMMMIAIVEELSKRLKSEPAKHVLLSYFFCQNTDQRLNTTAAVLRGLIFMLIRQQTTLIHHLRKRYEEAGDNFLQGPNSVYALLDLLFNILEDPELLAVYFMVDALDECDADIHQLIERITRRRSSSDKVKWIMSSRNEPAFKEQLQHNSQLHTSLELNSTHVSRAVEHFIDRKVDDLKRRKQYSKELSTYVKDSLVQKADGTFLWAALVCKALRNVAAWKTKSAIEKFPPGLEPLYDRMMVQLHNGGDDEDVVLYEKMIRSITLVCRPLSVAELPILARLPEELQGNRETIEDLISRCGSFLTIRQDTVYLVHQSAKDYFSTGSGKSIFPAGQPVEHAKITRMCSKLMEDTLKRDICDLRVPGISIDEIDSSSVERCLPLTTQYACLYWLDHLQGAFDDSFFHDNGLLHVFYQHQLLTWLEALSLMKKLSEGLSMIMQLEVMLEAMVEPNPRPSLCAWTHDVKRFMLEFSSVMAEAPLQVYACALVFSPNRSLVKSCYSAQLPSYLKRLPKFEDHWSPALQTFEGHEDGVNCVKFSPGGHLLASCSDDSTIRLWNPRTGGLQHNFKGHTSGVYIVQFSPDGRLLVSGSSDCTLRLWSVSTGEMLGILKGHTGAIYTVAFSPDGNSIASGSADCSVRLWNISTYEAQHVFSGHTEVVVTVRFSPNGQLLASSSADKSVRLWDPSSGESRHTLAGHTGAVYQIVFSPDGQFLASGSSDNTIRLWSPITGGVCKELMGHTSAIFAIVFSHEGQLLASGSSDATIRLWDPETGEARFKLDGHTNIVRTLVFSPDDRLLASGSDDLTIQIWDVLTGELRSIFKGHIRFIQALSFSPDGQVLASGSQDRNVRLWDTGMRKGENEPREHSGAVCNQHYSSDNKLLAISFTNGLVSLWNSDTEKVSRTFEGHTDRVDAITFSPNGQMLASGSEDKSLRLWDHGTGDTPSIIKGSESPIWSIAFSHDGQLLASVSADHVIRLWASSSGELCRVLLGHTEWVSAVVFSPDDLFLASGSYDQTVRLWEVRTGEVQYIFDSGMATSAFAFSPDGELLASGSFDGEIHVRESMKSKVQHILKGHVALVKVLLFSIDSQLLVSASRDHSVRLWDLTTGDQLQKLAPYSVSDISFSVDGTYLKTNCGFIRIVPWQSSTPDPLLSLCRWRFQKDWFYYDNHRVLWLPAEFRGRYIKLLEGTDNRFAEVLASGLVVVFEFDPNPDL